MNIIVMINILQFIMIIKDYKVMIVQKIVFMVVRERVLLATPGHRDKDWMPPPTHQQLKSFSHATTKKVLAGEGLRLTSRELVCY